MAAQPSAVATASAATDVVRLAQLDRGEVEGLVARYGAELVWIDAGAAIPGSYWGEPEAGLAGDCVLARADTPAHSVLHELSHYVCMDSERRAGLATDAGGTDDEECGVCYLQVLLADLMRGFGRERGLRDMNAWGYTFREGSAEAWFAGDGRLARDWLLAHGLIDAAARPTFRVR